MLLLSDVDECVTPKTNECDSNVLCTNIDRSYVCHYLKSFEGDGKICPDNLHTLVA